MANKVLANEWLEIAKHNLEAAILLFDANHYTDVVAAETEQAVEKLLKAVLALADKRIPKTHDLVELAGLLDDMPFAADELELLERATLYYREDRYPSHRYSLPPWKEVKEVLEFAKELHERVTELVEESK